MAKRVGPSASESSVQLYEVYNTAHRSLLVLAPDKSTALDIAYNANHTHWILDRKDKSYPHVAEVREPLNQGKLANCGAAIQTAIAERLQGTVHLEGDHVCVGYQIVRD